MPLRSDLFYKNQLYQLLSDQTTYSKEILQNVNSLLHEHPDLAELCHPKEGSYFHIICRNSNGQENIAFRMIYALSNAGADPNVMDAKGNTPLHEALMRDFDESQLDLVQGLFRVGVDPRIANHEGNTADAYLKDNPQLTALYKGYGEGIWAAIETSNLDETNRLIKGFIKVDCKHNSNKTLLDIARDLDCTTLINILADNQVTIEFLHSIFACDWDRVLLIHKYEKEFLKINSSDSIHFLTRIRPMNRSCTKFFLEYCLDTQSSQPFDILFNSSLIQIDVNVFCTDGLPFYFHCFNENISNEIRKKILFNSNMFMKSSKGETFLFHLIHLYSQNEKKEYLQVFMNILHQYPLLLTQRNQREQTIIEEIEFTSPLLIYNKLKPIYDIIMNVLVIQLKNNLIIEQFILLNFGYYLLIFIKDKKLQMTKYVYKLVQSLTVHRGLPVLMLDFVQAIVNDDLVKFKSCFKIRSNIYHTKDYAGRTCAHLAVLYQRYNILTFICDNYAHVLNSRDNLNRTSLHYACIMNDTTSIEMLERSNAKKMIDCLNLYPNDYILNRELCSEEFYAQDFPTNELERKSLGIGNYLKIAFYPNLKKSIENNSVEEINLINNQMLKMNFFLKDFNPDSYLNDYVEGQRYIPLLFLALQHHSIASIQCLIELGIPLIGRMYITKSELQKNSRWSSLHSRKEGELEYLDIIDIVKNSEYDIELKNIFQQQHIVSLESVPKETPEESIRNETPEELIPDETPEESIRNETPQELMPDETPKEIEQAIKVNSDKLSKPDQLMKYLRRSTQQDMSTKSKTCILL